MKEITDLNEIKNIELDILQQVHDFCEKNNIRYSLCGGTLIGAIRHKGFIPWDDDIDIMMLRSDYERFVSTFKMNGYSVHNYKNDKGYLNTFAKVYNDKTLVIENGVTHESVYVDVFPVDDFPNNGWATKSTLAFRKFLFRFATYKSIPLFSKKYSIVKQAAVHAIRFLSAPFSAHTISAIINKYCARFHEKSPVFRGVLVFGYDAREILDANVFDEYIDLDFEGRKFKTIKNYNAYLKSIYGDYMKLPPEEERVGHHDIVAYWKD